MSVDIVWDNRGMQNESVALRLCVQTMTLCNLADQEGRPGQLNSGYPMSLPVIPFEFNANAMLIGKASSGITFRTSTRVARMVCYFLFLHQLNYLARPVD